MTTSVSALPSGLRDLIAALPSADANSFRLVGCGNQLDGRDLSEVAGQLALNDVDVSVLDVNHITLTAGPYNFQTIRIQQHAGKDVAVITGFDLTSAQRALETTGVPANIAHAAAILQQHGFGIAHTDVRSSMKRIALLHGNRFDGITAYLTWL